MKDAFEKRPFVPMNFLGRVSLSEYDEGFDNYQNLLADGYKIEVLLNGVVQDFIVTADPIAGQVIRYRTIKGAPVVHGMAWQTETVCGDVAVRLRRG